MTSEQGSAAVGRGGGQGEFALPTGRLLMAGVIPGAAVAALGGIIAGLGLHPAGMGVLLGGLASAVGSTLGPLVIRPGVARPAAAWPGLLLGAQGISFFGVILLGALLYFAAPSGKTAVALSAGGSFTLAMIAQALVFSTIARAHSARNDAGERAG